MDDSPLKQSRECSLPKRHIVTFMAFLGLALAFCLKVNLSVAIVAMVNHSYQNSTNNSYFAEECPSLINENEPVHKSYKGERYNWNPTQQGFILSAFFYGYAISKFPGGYMATKFGAVRLFGICNLLASLLTLLTPVVVRLGVVPLITLRFLEGLSEGALYPSAIAIISLWAPKMERSRMTSIVFAGASIGNVISFSISGVLSSSGFLGGWPSVFYFFGGLGCLWYLFWFCLISETPQHHPTISKEELLRFKDNLRPSSKKVPWRKMLVSLPFWAIVISAVGNMFEITIIVTEIPTYLNSILHFNIRASGFLTALPNISQVVGAWLSAMAADKIRSTNKFRITTIRKVFNSIAGYGVTICLIIIAYSGCRPILIVTLFTLQLFINGFKFSGFVTSTIDMSPEYAGIINGLANGVANIAASFAPTMTGAILANGITIHNWGIVFCVTAAVYFLTTSFYAIFGSSELQPWADSDQYILGTENIPPSINKNGNRNDRLSETKH